MGYPMSATEVKTEVVINDTVFLSLMALTGREFSSGALMKAITLRQRKWISDNFEQEGKLSVGGWVALRAETIARRRKNSSKILQDRGRLKGSFDTLDIGDRFAVVGSRMVYAATHNFGRGGIPARRMLPSKEQGVDLAESVIKAVIEKFRNKRR